MEQLIARELDDPYNLQVKALLIQEYRKISYMIEASEVRERYLQISPLSEEMWLEWIEDLPATNLYIRALKDFYFLLKYLNTIESTQLSLFFSKIKEFTRDVNVWLTYISLLEDVESIRIAYAELFGTPKPGLENAWKSYEHWEKNEKAKANNREVYLKTFALWVTEEEHFVALGKAEEYSIARLKCYFEHVRSTEKRYIYEEVLIKFPNSLDIWTDYLVFTMPDKFKALQVAKRSVRNCPSSASLWSNLFLCLENLEKSIEKQFVKSLSNPFAEGNDYTKLWREYSQNVNRHGGDHISILIQGEAWLKAYCPPQHLVLKAYRGQITQDSLVFEEIVKEQGSSAAVWEVYIKFLEEQKDPKLRQVYLRAIEYTKDNPQSIINRYLDWENRFHSLSDIIQARIKCHKRLSKDVEPAAIKSEKFKMKAPQIATRFTGYLSNIPRNLKEHQLEEILRQIIHLKVVRIVRDRKGNSRGFAYCDFESEEDLVTAVKDLNGKEIQGNIVKIAVSKPPEENQNTDLTVFVNNLPFEISEEELENSLSEFGRVKSIRIIRGPDGNCKGYAYAEFLTEKTIENICEKGFIMIKNRRVLLQKFSGEKEQKFILHVSNLPYTVEDNELVELFPGAISANIPKDKLGKSRGFGFVEFDNESDAIEVLEKENPCLNGRHLVVKRSYKKPTEKKPLNNMDFKQFLA